MTHDEKVEAWMKFAREMGLPESIARQPTDKLLSALGIEARPVIFWRLPVVAAAVGVFFGVFWGLWMFLTVWRDKSVLAVAIASAASGVPFGLFVASFQLWQRKRWKIPSWETFSAE